MKASRHIRNCIAMLRVLPVHPQWLLHGSRERLALLGHAEGRVLDIGCADRWVEADLPPNCEYIGLDYPATGAALYSARPCVFSDAAALPFIDAAFDTVILFEALEHIELPVTALAEVARVLRPQGRLLLTMPFMYPMHDEPHDYQRYTRHGLIREMHAAGLQVTHLEGTLNSAESGGLLMSLAIGGMAKAAIAARSPALVLIPLLALLIIAINCTAWVLGRLLPDWPALTSNFQLVATKAAQPAEDQLLRTATG